MRIRDILIKYLFVAVLGFIFHFAYDFFNVDFLKIIFPQNESIFEHLKLIIFPSLILMLLELLLMNNRSYIFRSFISGIVVACVFMITAYYTYSGIIGQNIDYVNIAIFFISIMIVFYYRYKKITLFDSSNSVIAFIVLLLFIEIFTFYPGNIDFFK
ncbi:MAG: hypothetical protein IJY14_00015 [Acholeplasmatales bacterium]|nr:hypothetical protein [Acholeplasmatales bacterium]